MTSRVAWEGRGCIYVVTKRSVAGVSVSTGSFDTLLVIRSVKFVTFTILKSRGACLAVLLRGFDTARRKESWCGASLLQHDNVKFMMAMIDTNDTAAIHLSVNSERLRCANGAGANERSAFIEKKIEEPQGYSGT